MKFNVLQNQCCKSVGDKMEYATHGTGAIHVEKIRLELPLHRIHKINSMSLESAPDAENITKTDFLPDSTVTESQVPKYTPIPCHL